jgi:hypothetical protein
MPADAKLPRAFGCGWIEGESGAESRCAILSCRRSGLCEGAWAEDLYRMMLASAGADPFMLSSRPPGKVLAPFNPPWPLLNFAVVPFWNLNAR